MKSIGSREERLARLLQMDQTSVSMLEMMIHWRFLHQQSSHWRICYVPQQGGYDDSEEKDKKKDHDNVCHHKKNSPWCEVRARIETKVGLNKSKEMTNKRCNEVLVGFRLSDIVKMSLLSASERSFMKIKHLMLLPHSLIFDEEAILVSKVPFVQFCISLSDTRLKLGFDCLEPLSSTPLTLGKKMRFSENKKNTKKSDESITDDRKDLFFCFNNDIVGGPNDVSTTTTIDGCKWSWQTDYDYETKGDDNKLEHMKKTRKEEEETNHQESEPKKKVQQPQPVSLELSLDERLYMQMAHIESLDEIYFRRRDSSRAMLQQQQLPLFKQTIINNDAVEPCSKRAKIC
jgi:hypothetical protein